jgi:HEAT repeat protein
MKIASSHLPAGLAFLLIGSAAAAQTPPREKPPVRASANPDLSTLAAGWAYLAAGRTQEAVRTADGVLAARPGDHRALDLKIEALAPGGPLQALDAYETWLGRTRLEDVYLLTPIARGTLEQIAAAGDRPLALQALQKLAATGTARDAARLQELLKGGGGPGGGAAQDVQLAIDGDVAAAQRLTEPKAAASVPPQALAKALMAAGPMGVPMLRSLLKHPAAPVRMEAALTLGKLGATDAVPDIKAMMNDPEVRSFAGVALARLGDPEGEAVAQELLRSDVFDMRLLGAQAYEGKGPGPWVQALMPALRDPNGLTRVRAAELLAPVAPDAALPVLLEASTDPNPVVRADVMRIVERTGLLATAPRTAVDQSQGSEAPAGLAQLRRLLRDADPAIRLHAAGTILGLVKP